ncbi:hypothetical protein CYMTET_7266 [Cymbomonas tetramitiformis]|uniref:Uncharacterized protein n=1 Tax=Cymbomonas tetramitiformis TaxID=36881 RepID=A0AAE0GVT8_9CHLO|nr:hypothetical protein CYMTET_7266 [Cymbomonas tetramitiformis]
MSRKYKMFERLDPDFYAAVRAELGGTAGPGVVGAAYSGADERIVEVLGQLTSRLEKIEAAIKFQKVGDGEGDAEAMHTLALCQIFQVAADNGAEAFAAAVAGYGAPAVLAGGESDDIDVSAYGFTVSGSDSGVLTELETLTSQVNAMEEKVVPHVSGASAGGVPAGNYHYGVPTEEFPGGVELEPGSFVEAPGCASAVRRQQVVGCGAPPFGLRPHFVMLACFIGLLAFGIAGVAAGFAGGDIDGIDNNNDIYNSVATETPVMHAGACLHLLRL